MVGPADPAGAAKLFTIDKNANQLNDIDGTDDLPFAFHGSTGGTTDCSAFNGLLVGGVPFVASTTGDACGYIRAVDIFQIDKAVLQAQADGPPPPDGGDYVDFSGGTVPLNFFAMDVLIVDVLLAAGSAPVDEIGVGVSTDPLAIDPDGAGFFDACANGTQMGCAGLDRYGVGFPGGETPYALNDIYIQPGSTFPFPPWGFPGAALFEFDKNGDPANGNMLDGGEVSRRLFVAWADTGADSPLNKTGQVAKFMISSGTNQDFFVNIVPEPGTAAIMGLGLVLLGAARRRGLL